MPYYSCLHIKFWYTIPFSQSRRLNNENLNFECYSNLDSSPRPPKVCQIRFADVLWSSCEDKLTVLKTVVFQASVHVLPMGLSCAIMAAFGCFSVPVFLHWVTPFALASFFFFFLSLPLLFFFVALSCCDFPGSGAILQCIYINQ